MKTPKELLEVVHQIRTDPFNPHLDKQHVLLLYELQTDAMRYVAEELRRGSYYTAYNWLMTDPRLNGSLREKISEAEFEAPSDALSPAPSVS